MKKSFFKALTAVLLCIVAVMCATACSETPVLSGESIAPGASTLGSPETANLTFYLQLDNIEGESKDRQHEKWIEITDFSHGSFQSVETELPDDVGTGKFMPITFTHKVDKATPKIQEACMKGSFIPRGKIEVTTSIVGKQEVIYKVVFEKVKIISAEVRTVTDAYGNSSVVEDVTLLVNKETWTVIMTGLDNTLGGNTEASFDQTKKC